MKSHLILQAPVTPEGAVKLRQSCVDTSSMDGTVHNLR